jgi:hypothetical protein
MLRGSNRRRQIGHPSWTLAITSFYLSAVETVENVVLRCVPRPVITGMTANAMPAAIRPYSIAVAPVSSFKNLIAGAYSRYPDVP